MQKLIKLRHGDPPDFNKTFMKLIKASEIMNMSPASALRLLQRYYEKHNIIREKA